MTNLRCIPDFSNSKPVVKTFFVFDKVFCGFPEMQIEHPFSSVSKKSLVNIKRPLHPLLESQKTEKQAIINIKT
jgi:hypothetical protein